jgi:hypothetical protein
MRNSDLGIYYCLDLIAMGLLIKEKNQTSVPFFILLIACCRTYQKLGGPLAVRLNALPGYPYLLLVVMELSMFEFCKVMK